ARVNNPPQSGPSPSPATPDAPPQPESSRSVLSRTHNSPGLRSSTARPSGATPDAPQTSAAGRIASASTPSSGEHRQSACGSRSVTVSVTFLPMKIVAASGSPRQSEFQPPHGHQTGSGPQPTEGR